MLASLTPLSRRALPVAALAALAFGSLIGPQPTSGAWGLLVASGVALGAVAWREGSRGSRQDGWLTAFGSLLAGLSAALLAVAWGPATLAGPSGGSGVLLALGLSAALSPWLAACARGAASAPRTLLWVIGLLLLLPGATLILVLPAEGPGSVDWRWQLGALTATGGLLVAWRLLVGDWERPLVVGSPAQQRRCGRARLAVTVVLPLVAGVVSATQSPSQAEALLLGALVIVAVLQGAPFWRSEPAVGTQRDRTAELESLAEYARLVAHEVRNSLSVLFSTTDLLRRDRETAQREELLDALSEEGDRVRDVIDQLTAYAGDGGVRVRSSLRLREIARSAARLAVVRQGWPEGLTVQLDLGRIEDDVVMADASRLENALGQVLFAAAQGPSTHVTVRAGSAADKRFLVVEGDGRASIDVSSQTPSELLSAADSGTALGLAVADRTLREHGGQLRLARSEAGGLRATLELPAEAG